MHTVRWTSRDVPVSAGLDKLRERAGMTCQEVADEMRVPTNLVVQWELGQCRMFLPDAYDYAKAVGCSLEEMCDFVPRRTPVRRCSPVRTQLRRERNARGLTVRQAAKDIGVSEDTLIGWEKGEREPSRSSRVKLARFYGCTPETIRQWCVPDDEGEATSDDGSAA